MIKLSIALGIAGAILACVADCLLIGQPVSGAELQRLGLKAMLGVSHQRLLLGGALGALAFCLQSFAFYAVYRGLAPAGRWLASLCVSLFILALFFGTAWHMSYPFLGAALNYETGANLQASEDFGIFYGQLVSHLAAAYYCWRYTMIAASVLLAVAVLFQPTHFPRWYIVFAPYIWVYLGSLLLPLAPAPLGGYLLASGVNLAMLVFFAATGASLWSYRQEQP